jgi:hypothetical protein
MPICLYILIYKVTDYFDIISIFELYFINIYSLTTLIYDGAHRSSGNE